MKKLTVIIEITGTGFSCYAKELDGIIGVGDTIEATQQSFLEALAAHVEYIIEQGGADSLEGYEVTFIEE
jgi:predicted RNase H-like HicB family nuclease